RAPLTPPALPPPLTRRRQDLRQGHAVRRLLVRDTGRAGAAEGEYRAAVALQRQLAADFPIVADYQNDLAGTMVNLAILLRERKEFEPARQLLEDALPYHRAALKANPRKPAYR